MVVLSDLFRWTGQDGREWTEVTVADLVEVLQGLGAGIHLVDCGREGCDCTTEDQIEAWFPPGRYLVWRIEEEK